jgi:hypothetical protein
MITAKTLDELSSLLEKATKKYIKVNPYIEIVETGLYKVEGTKGNFYEVRAGRTETQEFFIACTCRGALESKPCYHAAGVFLRHTSIKSLEIRLTKSAEMENAPYLKEGSDKKPETVGNIRI